jgi:phosphotriesterase-related protein
MNRKTFLQKSTAAAGIFLFPALLADDVVMTVTGPIRPADMKFTLEHEHVLADFIGAKGYSRDRYNADEVFARALPFLKDVKQRGCVTFIDCSPAYLGRDVLLFKRLAEATGLNFITNTGYYGAVGEKFLPPQVYTETSEQIAARWIDEFKNGIEGTGIKPGFIKTSVDNAPLTEAQRKVVDSAALTHLATGLTIAIHTGNGEAAKEELAILKARGVSPQARIWVHAQNETDKAYHVEAAQNKSWVAFDGVNPDTVQANIAYLQNMKAHKLLDNVLVSQDSGWYNVGEPNGGNYKDYNCIFTQFIPAMKANGFTELEIKTIFVTNPAKAFALRVRKL